MEVMTYNIWDLPLWFVRNRGQRIMRIAEYIVSRNTDIVCIQESWSLRNRKMLSDYLQSKGYYDAVSIAGIKRNNGGLLTFSKFPIKEISFIPFGRWSLSVSEAIGNKGALKTIIESPKGLVTVVNTHLHYQSSKFLWTTSVRLRQLRAVMKALVGDTHPVIMAGDFNQESLNTNDTFRSIFEKAGFVIDQHTHYMPTYRKENHFVDNWINRVSRSHCYDYIFVKPTEAVSLVVADYKALYLDPVLSDHDPVVAVVQ